MKNLRLFRSYIAPGAIKNVAKLLARSNEGAYIGEGPEVKAFEEEFGKRFGLKNVCALNSGTAALELAYDLIDLKEGDEVITPILTCTATNIPIVRRKAKLVFADIDRDLNVSVEDVKKKITRKTKAIVFVHFGGNNRGLKELLKIAKDNRLPLIEDAAQAVGSDFWGKADITCVSFQAIKTLTTGDGGAIICKDDEMHKKAKRLRWFGYDRELKHKLGDTDLIEPGYKYHMNDIAAVIGRANLKVFNKLVAHQNKLIKEYKKQGINAYPWFAWVLTDKREALREHLRKHGIDSGMHHFRNDQYTICGGRQKRGFPVMDELEEKYLLLPLHPFVTVRDVRRIAALIKDFEKN